MKADKETILQLIRNSNVVVTHDDADGFASMKLLSTITPDSVEYRLTPPGIYTIFEDPEEIDRFKAGDVVVVADVGSNERDLRMMKDLVERGVYVVHIDHHTFTDPARAVFNELKKSDRYLPLIEEDGPPTSWLIYDRLLPEKSDRLIEWAALGLIGDSYFLTDPNLVLEAINKLPLSLRIAEGTGFKLRPSTISFYSLEIGRVVAMINAVRRVATEKERMDVLKRIIDYDSVDEVIQDPLMRVLYNFNVEVKHIIEDALGLSKYARISDIQSASGLLDLRWYEYSSRPDLRERDSRKPEAEWNKRIFVITFSGMFRGKRIHIESYVASKAVNSVGFPVVVIDMVPRKFGLNSAIRVPDDLSPFTSAVAIAERIVGETGIFGGHNEAGGAVIPFFEDPREAALYVIERTRSLIDRMPEKLESVEKETTPAPVKETGGSAEDSDEIIKGILGKYIDSPSDLSPKNPKKGKGRGRKKKDV